MQVSLGNCGHTGRLGQAEGGCAMLDINLFRPGELSREGAGMHPSSLVVSSSAAVAAENAAVCLQTKEGIWKW